MGIVAPNMGQRLEDAYLDVEVERALQDGEDIEGFSFYGERLPDADGETVEFRMCRFEKCDLRTVSSGHFHFVDCVFDHCDISGAILGKSALQRVKFAQCRLTGLRLSEGTLMNTAFEDCQMDYVSMDKEKVQHVEIKRCTMKESMLIGIKWSDFVLADTVMDGAELSHMPLKGLDLSKCTFSHLRVDPAALRGMKVTGEQALKLSLLLGLVIAD